MTLQLEEDLARFPGSGEQPAEDVARELIVLELYRQRRILSGKAAQLLSESREDFLDRAARADICYLDLSPAELNHEFEAAEQTARAHDI
jgi:predicted HTH domain antitoxin